MSALEHAEINPNGVIGSTTAVACGYFDCAQKPKLAQSGERLVRLGAHGYKRIPDIGARSRPAARSRRLPAFQRHLDRTASTSAIAAKTPPSVSPTVSPGCMAAVVASAVSPG